MARAFHGTGPERTAAQVKFLELVPLRRVAVAAWSKISRLHSRGAPALGRSHARVYAFALAITPGSAVCVHAPRLVGAGVRHTCSAPTSAAWLSTPAAMRRSTCRARRCAPCSAASRRARPAAAASSPAAGDTPRPRPALPPSPVPPQAPPASAPKSAPALSAPSSHRPASSSRRHPACRRREWTAPPPSCRHRVSAAWIPGWQSSLPEAMSW